MERTNLSTSHPGARFCARYGNPLHSTNGRLWRFAAAHPDQQLRALAVISTLMRHLSGRRHRIHHGAIVLALPAALIAATFGMPSIALILAAIALPAVVLTNVRDHAMWCDEPIAIIGLASALSLLPGAATELLEPYLITPVPVAASTQHPFGQPARTPRTVRGVPVALMSADPINIGQNISIIPAPGWTLGIRGPNWVLLYNDDSSARMQVVVKPASATDVVAVLQADINRLTNAPATSLTNVVNLSGPDTKTLGSANFQQQASIDYTANVSTQQGTIPVLGVFAELLNPSNHLSAFIDFRQDGEATTQAARDGGMMIHSML